MTSPVLQFGTQIAADVRSTSGNSKPGARNLKTISDLLDMLAENPPSALPMLRTTCSLLGVYLDKPVDQVLIDSVNETRNGFRSFLESRQYAQNSIRTYVNHVRILLKNAKELGWEPTQEIPEEWRGVLALAAEKKCLEVVKYLAGIRQSPRDVTIEDVESWGQMRIKQGFSSQLATRKKSSFWLLLRDCGCTDQTPTCILREKNYGVPLDEFPPTLQREVRELLKWKQAQYSLDRPKDGRHRKVTSTKLQHVFSAVFGFATKVQDESGITSLQQLIKKPIIGGFAAWSINERRVKGQTLQNNLRLLSAALQQHPSYASLDLSWFKPLVDGLPAERESELKKRKAEKYLPYEIVESIPAKIRSERPAAEKRGQIRVARLAMDELLMKWLVTLPWRQRNIRECRISGPEPNLFKAKIPLFSDIDKPKWVIQEEQKNPASEFWQFRFSIDETKTGIEVCALLPRQLVGLLEEYLKHFRTYLLKGSDPGTLFLNRAGKPMSRSQMTESVSDMTLRYGGRRVSPHLFRDVVAYTWLKEHPKDFLTLSKMLWHSNINTTIKTYGSRFNESSGVSAMESWLDEREAKST